MESKTNSSPIVCYLVKTSESPFTARPCSFLGQPQERDDVVSFLPKSESDCSGCQHLSCFLPTSASLDGHRIWGIRTVGWFLSKSKTPTPPQGNKEKYCSAFLEKTNQDQTTLVFQEKQNSATNQTNCNSSTLEVVAVCVQVLYNITGDCLQILHLSFLKAEIPSGFQMRCMPIISKKQPHINSLLKLILIIFMCYFKWKILELLNTFIIKIEVISIQFLKSFPKCYFQLLWTLMLSESLLHKQQLAIRSSVLKE